MSMVEWAEITCQRAAVGHAHVLREVNVRLGGPTPYHDLTDIPVRLARQFVMWVFDPDSHPVDGGPYCPAHDAVSETIAKLGVWEPAETTLALQVLSTAEPGQIMLDFGCQIGWYSLLAASYGVGAVAVDADSACLDLVRGSARENGWGELITTQRHRFGQGSFPVAALGDKRVRLVKIDLEGAEDSAVADIWPLLTAGRVDHLMMEVSPCWAPYYPDLVADLAAVGMVPYEVPDKRNPPIQMDETGVGLAGVMEAQRLVGGRADITEVVRGWTQRDMWFRREGESW